MRIFFLRMRIFLLCMRIFLLRMRIFFLRMHSVSPPKPPGRYSSAGSATVYRILTQRGIVSLCLRASV
jgi:hypothetical protein